MNQVLRDLEPHSSRRLSEAVFDDPQVIDLTVGYPHFGPPVELREELRKFSAAKSGELVAWDLYAPGKGTRKLREAIVRLYPEDEGIDPEREVLVTNGAAGALTAALVATTEPGDEVLLPDPCYTLYEPLVRCLGREAKRVPTTEEEGFTLAAAALEAAGGSRSKVVIVNSPANPTGSLYPARRLRDIAAAAASIGLVVLSDEVMDCFAGDDYASVRSVASQASVAVVNSFSKRFGMTGWRLGWMVGDPDLIEQAAKAQAYMTLAVSHPVQEAAATALNSQTAAAELTAHAASVRENGRWLAEALAAPRMPPLRVASSGLGFYHWIDVSEAVREWGLEGKGTPGERAAGYLLEQHRLAVVPGIAFGSCGANFVRASFAGSKSSLAAAVECIASVA